MKSSLSLLLLLCIQHSLAAGDWPQWRGPYGTGVSRDRRLPIFWSEQRNLKWKCELPRYGTSSPITWGNAVFLTSQVEDGRLVLIRINKTTGKIEWNRVVGKARLTRGNPQRKGQTFHRLHNMASPTPVTDGRFVAAHFGNGDLAVFKLDGTLVWKRNLQQEQGRYTIWWGYGNSPVLHNNSLMTVCMQDSVADREKKSPAKSYLIAHDVRDGHVRWRVERDTKAKGEQGDSYTTPLLVGAGGERQLVIMGANQLDSYDPDNGKQLWLVRGFVGARTITGPTHANGFIYSTIGGRGALLSVKLPKKKQLGKLPRRAVKWRRRGGTPDTCCPVVWDRFLFTITDDGIARCLLAETGLVKWKRRLPGKYKASPVAVAGRIFFLNTQGLCTVVSARARFDKLTQNQLDDETIASPAVSDGALFIRGRKSLYCVSRP